MTTLEAMEIVAMLTAAYPSWKPTEASLRLYAKLLEPLDADFSKPAVMELLYSPREFAPPIGVLADAIAVRNLKQAGQYLSPEEAWAEVMDRIRDVGVYLTPTFSSPALTRAVQALGWRGICTNENVEANRAHFMRIFDALQRSHVREEIGLLVRGDLAALRSQAPPPPQLQTAGAKGAERRPSAEELARVRDMVRATLAKLEEGKP
jgi:hypothetical protein